MSEVSAFLLTEDGRLMVQQEHWLRDLASEAPDPDTALRLLVAGLAFQSVATRPTPDLDRALDQVASGGRGTTARERRAPSVPSRRAGSVA